MVYLTVSQSRLLWPLVFLGHTDLGGRQHRKLKDPVIVICVSDKTEEGLFPPILEGPWGGTDRSASRLAGLEPGALVSKSVHPYTCIQIKTCIMSLYFFTSPKWLPGPGGEASVLAGTGFFLHLVVWRGG